MCNILLGISFAIMTDRNPFVTVLENRIKELLPLGLSAIWLKVNGINDFNMGKLLGFEYNEWDVMLNLSRFLNKKGINFNLWKNCFNGIKVETVDYRTRENLDQSKWIRFYCIHEWVLIELLISTNFCLH